MFKKNGSASGM